MFTWIIEKQVRILNKENGRFTVENPFSDLTIWQSITHDGACMTLTDITPESYSFFVMEESLSRTNFGKKKIWDTFNIERCLIANGRLDGHFVTGHIDTVGTVTKIEDKSDKSRIITISFPSEHADLLVEKWSITINGISLTVVDVGAGFFTISLIPHTLEVTNIGQLRVNDIVNLEFDLLGKYIAKQLEEIRNN